MSEDIDNNVGGVFVPGKPFTDIWAAPGLRWRDTIAAYIAGPLRHPRLAFTRKDKSWYDLDNLVYPVLAVTGPDACESVWATVECGEPEGVLVSEAVPPPPPDDTSALRLHIARPSASSVRDRPSVAELAGIEPYGDTEPIGLALEFDAADVTVGNLSYDGPIKSCVDHLTPLFGETMISGRMLAKDYRVRELRITRGHAPQRAGVDVTLWRLPQPDPTPEGPPTAHTTEPVAARRVEQETNMWTTFLDDDHGFLRWRDTHPHGFIVNHEREPKPGYLKLHRATCRTISGTQPASGDNWTTALGKTCDEDVDELRRWADGVGGELDACRVCRP